MRTLLPPRRLCLLTFSSPDHFLCTLFPSAVREVKFSAHEFLGITIKSKQRSVEFPPISPSDVLNEVPTFLLFPGLYKDKESFSMVQVQVASHRGCSRSTGIMTCQVRFYRPRWLWPHGTSKLHYKVRPHGAIWVKSSCFHWACAKDIIKVN